MPCGILPLSLPLESRGRPGQELESRNFSDMGVGAPHTPRAAEPRRWAASSMGDQVEGGLKKAFVGDDGPRAGSLASWLMHHLHKYLHKSPSQQ